MLNPKISPANLLLLIKKHFADQAWWNYEPETVMLELGEDSDNTLIYEKVMALKVLMNIGLEEALSNADFVLRFTEVCNNNETEPEIVPMPTSLELAWTVVQLQLICIVMGTHFEAPGEFGEIVGYLLREDGFSKRVDPFTFVPEAMLTPGQTDTDTQLKSKAIVAYISHMRSECHA